MPVRYLPCATWLLLIGGPLLFLARGRKSFVIALAVSLSIVVLLYLWVYVPGWVLMSKAAGGDPRAQYELARWAENHCEQMQAIL
jgi:hypothetical protein